MSMRHRHDARHHRRDLQRRCGALSRHPLHLGRTLGHGAAPAGRIEGASSNAKDRLPNGFMSELKKFYYDLAGASNPGAVASLLKLVTTSHVLFGTDFPPGGTSAEYVKR
jgi:hypothetical protein